MQKVISFFTKTSFNERHLKILIFTATCILYLNNYSIFQEHFHSLYLDADQLIVAEAAKSYATGSIPEPYFWGQNYLFLIESFLAIPLILLGIQSDIATKLVCGVLFYLPFILTVAYLCKKRMFTICPWFVLFPLILPFKFILVAQMPRGFMGSVGLGATALFFYITSKHANVKSAAAFIIGMCGSSFSSSMLFLPLLILGFDFFKSSVRIFIFSSAGIISVKLLGLFYMLNPDYIIHQSNITCHIGTFLSSIQNAIVIEPLITAIPIFSVIFILYSSKLMPLRMRSFQRLILALLGLIACISIMLSANKINDATESIFFSGLRFWLPIPYFFLMICLYYTSITLEDDLHSSNNKQQINKKSILKNWTLVMALISLTQFQCFLWLKNNSENEFKKYSPVALARRIEVIRSCNIIKGALTGYEYGQINGRNDILAYGCSALLPIKVIQTEYERRKWLTNKVNKHQGSVKLIPISGFDK